MGDLIDRDRMEYTGDEVPHFCPDCGANMEAIE